MLRPGRLRRAFGLLSVVGCYVASSVGLRAPARVPNLIIVMACDICIHTGADVTWNTFSLCFHASCWQQWDKDINTTTHPRSHAYSRWIDVSIHSFPTTPSTQALPEGRRWLIDRTSSQHTHYLKSWRWLVGYHPCVGRIFLTFVHSIGPGLYWLVGVRVISWSLVCVLICFFYWSLARLLVSVGLLVLLGPLLCFF